MIEFEYESIRDDNDKLEHYTPNLYKSPHGLDKFYRRTKPLQARVLLLHMIKSMDYMA